MKKRTRFTAAMLVFVMLLSMILPIMPITSFAAAAVGEAPVAGSMYMIVSKSSGKAMTVEGNSADNDAGIIQKTAEGYASQVWTMQDGGNGTFIFVNYSSKKAMNVPDNSAQAGTQMIQWNNDGGNNEKFSVTETADGYYRITPSINAGMGLNVDANSVDDGAAIIQWNYDGYDNEKWSFIPVTEVKANPIEGIPDPVRAIDKYLEMFFYVENGVGKLRNEPSNGFWTDAEILEVFIDAYEHLGDKKYLEAAELFYDDIIGRRGKNWSWNEYNDDIMWMTLATVRLYLNTNNPEYLEVAEVNFNLCYDRAWDTSFLDGGLWWRTQKDSKNACVNGPGALAALHLYEATDNQDYLDKGKAIVDWMIDRLYVADTGEIYDNIQSDDGEIVHWINTGNQGNVIAACTMLHQYTNDDTYYTVAKKAADCVATLGDGATKLLNEGSNSGDSIGGKGLLARWLGYYLETYNLGDYRDWILTNAQSAWNLRNSDDLMWGEFGRATNENIQNSDEPLDKVTPNYEVTKGKYAAWGCSAAVSWLINFDMEAWVVTSPDGNTVMNIMMDDAGKLTYNAVQDGVAVVEQSDLGIRTSVGDFTTGLTFVSQENVTINETYDVISGKKSEYTNHCVEKILHFTQGNVEFDVVARAYDDGIAFRYVIRTANGQAMTIQPNAEITSINLPDDSHIWYMPRTGNSFMYENEYENGKIGQVAVGTRPSMPMLYETNGKYGLIMEADRHGNYVGSLLQLEANGVMRTIFDIVQTTAVNSSTPFTSPWRTVILGSAADIMMNTMVENLSPAADEETYKFSEWVDPGLSSWSWVSYYGGQEDPDIHKKFIDLAADMGWKYYILDEEWQPGNGRCANCPNSNETKTVHYEGMRDWFTDVRDYANEKGIKLFVWVHMHDVDTDEEREARFKEWSEAGIVGIKVDFFYNESQEVLQLHDDIYADAAKYKLMVNVHGSNPSSGEIRTYPNIITREAIRGQEQGGIKVEQYTLIPFLRAAVGSADVTEQLYSRDTSKTTMGFQIALSTIVQNGLHSMGSKPEEYYAMPAAVSYYTNFPSTWDDMYVLDAEVGSAVNLARKSGDAWYAAGISVNARTFSYKPTFLDAGKTYTAIIYKEVAGQRQAIEMQKIDNVTANTTLSVAVQNGGGYAVKFVPQGADDLISITGKPANVSVEVYYTKDVTLDFDPDDSVSTDVVWTVADPTIVKISTTGKGATIKGLKEGTTTVTATSIYDNSKKAVINVTVTPARYTFDDETWDVINDNSNYIVTGENKVTITAETGVIDNNIFAMKATDANFEITAKISGGLNANYQGGFIGVFDRDRNPYVSIGRRYHTAFNSGGNTPNNHVTVMSNNSEQYVADPNPNGSVYVRLVKNGNDFTGYYKVNEGDNWTQAWTVTNAALAGVDPMYVGFYAGSGGSTNGIDVTISDFTYNDIPVKVAEFNPDALVASAIYEAENATLGGSATVEANTTASNGQHVFSLGGATGNGTVTFNVDSANAGTATLNIYYSTWDDRYFTVTVNGTDYTVLCPGNGNSWTNVLDEPVALEVELAEGANTIVFSGNTVLADGTTAEWAPNLDSIEVVYPEEPAPEPTKGEYEMENGTVNGGTLVNNDGASNGQHVGNIGGNTNGTVTFNIESETDGKATLSIYYGTYNARQLSVTVNGKVYTVDCPATGDWNTIGEPVTLKADVTAGTNTIVFGGVNGGWDGGNAPNLDKFTIEIYVPEEPDPENAYEKWLDAFYYVDNKGNGQLSNEPDNGFWTDAEMLEVMLDAYERIGKDEYKTVIRQYFDGIIARRGENWKENKFNDDVMWMVIASARAYLLTGETDYLIAAIENFNMCYDRAWSNDIGGGLWWTTDNNEKNACVNGPAAIAACLLGQATGNEDYYAKAKAIIDWEYETLVNKTNGAVSDNIQKNGAISTWASTYNQGTFIGAAAMLYKYYGEQTYFNMAKLAADYASTMGDGSEGLLNREQNTGDLIGFKGILGRWLGYFVRECDVDDYNDWMYNNAEAAWNNRNSDDLMWTQFGKKTEEDLKNSQTIINDQNTISKFAAWGSSAAVSWLLNYTGEVVVDLAEPYQPEQVEYEMESGTVNGGGVVNNAGASNGQHVGNLGGANNGTVTHYVESRADGKATLSIYYGTNNARQLSVTVNGTVYTLTCPATGGWNTIGGPVTIEVDVVEGTNTIVFGGVAGGLDGGNAPNLDRFVIDLPTVEAPDPLEFYGTSISLQSSLEINYLVEKSLFAEGGYSNPYVVFSFNGSTFTVTDYTEYGDYYLFSYENIGPHMMNDTITGALYATYDGQLVTGEVLDFSIARYCYSSLEYYNTDDYAELHTLIVDLLNYGAAAQTYVGYNTDNLANKDLTEAQAAWGTATNPTLGGVFNTEYKTIENATVTWSSISLDLQSSIGMYFLFEAESVEGLTVKVTTDSGMEWMLTEDNILPTTAGNHAAFFEELNPAQLRTTLYVTVYDGNVAVSDTMACSVEAYASAAVGMGYENLTALVNAMMKYGDSAYAYVN